MYTFSFLGINLHLYIWQVYTLMEDLVDTLCDLMDEGCEQDTLIKQEQYRRSTEYNPLHLTTLVT